MFDKSTALEAAKRFCVQKGLSVERLGNHYKQVISDKLYFGEPTKNASADLLKDMQVRPLVTLIVQTDYTVTETVHTYLLK